MYTHILTYMNAYLYVYNFFGHDEQEAHFLQSEGVRLFGWECARNFKSVIQGMCTCTLKRYVYLHMRIHTRTCTLKRYVYLYMWYVKRDIYLYMRIHTRTCTFTGQYIIMHTCAYIFPCMYKYRYVDVYIYVHVSMCVFVYVCVCVYVNIYMYTFTCTWVVVNAAMLHLCMCVCVCM